MVAVDLVLTLELQAIEVVLMQVVQVVQHQVVVEEVQDQEIRTPIQIIHYDKDIMVAMQVLTMHLVAVEVLAVMVKMDQIQMLMGLVMVVLD
jgi:hypothetical protein